MTKTQYLRFYKDSFNGNILMVFRDDWKEQTYQKLIYFDEKTQTYQALKQKPYSRIIGENYKDITQKWIMEKINK